MALHFELVTPERLVRSEEVHMVVDLLVTPERLVRSEEVHMVVVPGTEGDFGVLEGHAPFMSVVRNGELAIYSSPTNVIARIQVEGGFAEVNDRGLTVLAERAVEAA